MPAQGEEAGVELPVGGDPSSRAITAERLRDGGDDADLAGAVQVAVALCDLAAVRGLDRLERKLRADRGDDVGSRDHVVQSPAVRRADVHVLDEAHGMAGSAEAPGDVQDRALVQAALDDDVDFHGKSRLRGRVDAGEDARDREVDVVHLAEDLVVERVETHGDACEPGIRERLRLLREQGRIGRQCQVEVAERCQPPDQDLEVAAKEGLAASDPELVHAETHEHAGDALDLLERQELASRKEPVVAAEDLFRHAVHAPEVAAVGDRDPEIAERPREGVEQFHGDSVENRPVTQTRALPLAALVGVTAIWGLTFVQVQNALVLYPLFAFLAVRFFISTLVLAPFALGSLRDLPRSGYVAGIGVGMLLAAAYGFQTAGLELTTVTSTGFITGLYVVFTPLLALAFFGTRVPPSLWVGVALAVIGLLLLNGVPGGSTLGNALVLANAIFQAFQITAMERFAPRYDPRALTFLQMATAFVGFTVIAVALGELEVPQGATVWGALLVTGIFAGALGYLIATWVQARTTAARAALVFTLEAPFAALFGVLLADEILGWAGWLGCAVMMTGIVLAEPAAARALGRVAGRTRT